MIPGSVLRCILFKTGGILTALIVCVFVSATLLIYSASPQTHRLIGQIQQDYFGLDITKKPDNYTGAWHCWLKDGKLHKTQWFVNGRLVYTLFYDDYRTPCLTVLPKGDDLLLVASHYDHTNNALVTVQHDSGEILARTRVDGLNKEISVTAKNHKKIIIAYDEKEK